MQTVKGIAGELLKQRWQGIDNPEVIYSGEYMATRFTTYGIFPNKKAAQTFFLKTKVGEMFATGVSGYERISDRTIETVA